MVIIMDDEDRENEGDLLMVAAKVRADHVNFMVRHGRGLVCLTLTEERCNQLGLGPMARDNRSRMTTNFTVSIEAAEGVTTGISAADRATTIQAAVRANAGPRDVVQPGHIFPLRAARGGVLARAGHTEAGVDLARLSGNFPASVICEILNEDGSMARLPELESFARVHGLKIGTIADLIRYRLETESSVKRIDECRVATDFGDFRGVAYRDEIDGASHLALVRGDIRREWPVLVRVHVHSGVADLVTAQHRGGWTLHASLRRVAEEGAGVVVVLDQRSPADDLESCMRDLHDNESGGEPRGRRHAGQLRTYGLGSQILADLGVGKMRVLGNPVRTPGLSGFGIEIVGYIAPDDAAGVNHRRQSTSSRNAG
jgi:3,4-dihydroxy 2-butanone 4-phosphate synthase/GTP cyclohydrolase II